MKRLFPPPQLVVVGMFVVALWLLACDIQSRETGVPAFRLFSDLPTKQAPEPQIRCQHDLAGYQAPDIGLVQPWLEEALNHALASSFPEPTVPQRATEVSSPPSPTKRIIGYCPRELPSDYIPSLKNVRFIDVHGAEFRHLDRTSYVPRFIFSGVRCFPEPTVQYPATPTGRVVAVFSISTHGFRGFEVRQLGDSFTTTPTFFSTL